MHFVLEPLAFVLFQRRDATGDGHGRHAGVDHDAATVPLVCAPLPVVAVAVSVQVCALTMPFSVLKFTLEEIR